MVRSVSRCSNRTWTSCRLRRAEASSTCLRRLRRTDGPERRSPTGSRHPVRHRVGPRRVRVAQLLPRADVCAARLAGKERRALVPRARARARALGDREADYLGLRMIGANGWWSDGWKTQRERWRLREELRAEVRADRFRRPSAHARLPTVARSPWDADRPARSRRRRSGGLRCGLMPSPWVRRERLHGARESRLGSRAIAVGKSPDPCGEKALDERRCLCTRVAQGPYS
jgi:hypothetical protein